LQKWRPYLKNKTKNLKKNWGHSLVLTEAQALSQFPIPVKRKKKKERKRKKEK
jgi:hypothetical protein